MVSCVVFLNALFFFFVELDNLSPHQTKIADPAFSILLAMIILKSSLPLVRTSVTILMQATPEQIDLHRLSHELLDIIGRPRNASIHAIYWGFS